MGLTEPERAGYDQPGFRCQPELWPGGLWGPKLWGCERSGVDVPCHVLQGVQMRPQLCGQLSQDKGATET